MNFQSTSRKTSWIIAIVLCATVQVFSADRKSESWMESGLMAMEDGLYPEASKYFERVIKRAKEQEFRNQARLELFRSLYENGQSDQILPLIEKNPDSLASPSASAGMVYWQARLRLDQDKPVQALALLNTLERPIDPSWRAPIHFMTIEALKINGQWEEIISHCESFEAMMPPAETRAGSLLEKAKALAANKQILEASQIYESLSKDFPKSPVAAEASLYLAELRKNNAQLEGSITPLYERVVLETSFPLSLRERALFTWTLSLKESGETQKALDLIQQEDESLPKQSSNWLALEAELVASLGQLEKAQTLIRNAVEQAPNQAEGSKILLSYGDFLLDQEQYQAALDEFQLHLELFTLEEDRALATLGKAWSLYGLEKFSEAASLFKQAREKLPNSTLQAESLAKHGDALFKSGNFEESAEVYQSFIKTYPASSLIGNTTLQYAESLIRIQKLEEATQVLETFASEAKKPGHRTLAERRAAELYELQGNLEKALSVFENILTNATAPDVAPALLGRGRILYQQGKFYEALSDFEQIGGDFPDTRYAEQALALSIWCRYLLQQDDEALQLAKDFILNYKESPQAPHIQFWLAEYRFNRGEFDRAEPGFVRLTMNYPDHELADDALFWAGRSAFEQNSYSNAVLRFSQLLKEYPDSSKAPEAQFASGDVLSRLGQFSSAVEAFKTLIQNYPEHFLVDDAYGRMGDCHYTLGADDPRQYQLSRDAYATVLDRTSASEDMQVQALYKIGRCYQKMRNSEEARTHYLDAVYQYEQAVASGNMMSPIWFSRAAFAAADLMLVAKRPEQAANLYKRVVEAEVPASSDARNRLQKMVVDRLRIF